MAELDQALRRLAVRWDVAAEADRRLDTQVAKMEFEHRAVQVGQTSPLASVDRAVIRPEAPEVRRLAVVHLQRAAVARRPTGGVVDLDLANRPQGGPPHRNRKVHRTLRSLDPVPILKPVLLVLDVVENDEDVAAQDLFEVPKPRQVVRLVNSDDHSKNRWHSNASAAATDTSLPRIRASRSTFSTLAWCGSGRTCEAWQR